MNCVYTEYDRLSRTHQLATQSIRHNITVTFVAHAFRKLMEKEFRWNNGCTREKKTNDSQPFS